MKMGTIMNAVNVGGIVGIHVGVVTVSNKLIISLCVVMWLAVIVVADMNWPDHMGGSSGGLVETITNAL
tara:strand:+ start:1283 stop:1489 length:207 start_codon:yes stop_codon:yes gene_type:complete